MALRQNVIADFGCSLDGLTLGGIQIGKVQPLLILRKRLPFTHVEIKPRHGNSSFAGNTQTQARPVCSREPGTKPTA
jgi:hypothetical protein